jgi:homoserine kinase type II
VLEKQLCELIEKFYDIGAVRGLSEIFGGFNNRSFTVRAGKGHDTRTYFMRKYRDGMDIEEIRFEHALIRHAIEKGLTICADLIPTRSGNTLVQAAGGNAVFAVFENLTGKDKYTWCDTELTDSEYRSAAVVLAEFHDAVQAFDPGGLNRKEPPILDLLPVIAGNLELLERKMQPGRLQSYYRATLYDLLDTIERSLAVAPEMEGLPVIPAHYDFHPGNLKWEHEQVTGLFDFDWSKMDLRLFDVCMALVYCCSRWGGEHDGELRPDKVLLFLSSYQRRLQSRNGMAPLSGKEQRLLPDMLAMANMYLVHWEISNFYDNKERNENEYLKYVKHNTRLGRWLDTHRTAVMETIRHAG